MGTEGQGKLGEISGCPVFAFRDETYSSGSHWKRENLGAGSYRMNVGEEEEASHQAFKLR